MIDQRALPLAERYVTCTDYREVIAAINDLTVRGAPAIGVAAAMGIALGALQLPDASPEDFRHAFDGICTQFAATRPTARNLFWAIERMKRRFDEALARGMPLSRGGRDGGGPEAVRRRKLPPTAGSGLFAESATTRCGDDCAERGAILAAIREALVAEAIRIGEEDIAINRRLGQNGRDLIPDGARILTHCNAGALATAGYGTALGVIRAAREEGKTLHVYVDETRPVLQGARLTAWELMREAIPCTLIADNMAGFLMQQGKVDLVIVGADRIAANGDTANKIGTYGLAVLARAHGIPFYVAAPLSTIDPALAGRRGDPDRGAKPGRGDPLRRRPDRSGGDRGLESRLRCDAEWSDLGDRHRGGRDPAPLRGRHLPVMGHLRCGKRRHVSIKGGMTKCSREDQP